MLLTSFELNVGVNEVYFSFESNMLASVELKFGFVRGSLFLQIQYGVGLS